MKTTKYIKVQPPLRLMYILLNMYIYTVSVGSALQFLDNEYLFRGKSNMMIVDNSVYCRLRRHEILERDINCVYLYCQ